MVDHSREEHRMMIFGNDSDLVQEHLVRDETATEKNGILKRKTHAESYTVTLYILLKNYGLIPVIRIKPRIRFRRSNYDNFSSSAPLRFGLDDTVDFAELKQSITGEDVDLELLEQFFGDAPTMHDLDNHPALQFVSQRDLFLRQPPFKTKTKIIGMGPEMQGIPIGKFLDALNHSKQTERIFKPFPKGEEFAKDLLETLEPFSHLEFEFGIYSRYERRDCVFGSTDAQVSEGYRTTFDPWTVLGHIKTDQSEQQLQILRHERGTRWEHKIMIDQMDRPTLDLIAREIRSLRNQYLIGRILSKSKTGLSILADVQESQLDVVNELFVDYVLKTEITLPNNRFSNIEERKKLRQTFEVADQYQLYPSNNNIIERYLNLAKGLKKGVIYTLDNIYLTQSTSPEKVNIDGLTIIREPAGKRTTMRSAGDLRSLIPTNGFEKCWNETIDEGGYAIIDKKTSRCYVVSYGKRAVGSILGGKITVGDPEYYLSVKYLGISPSKYEKLPVDTAKGKNQVKSLLFNIFAKRKNKVNSLLFNILAKREDEIIREMKKIILYMHDQKSI